MQIQCDYVNILFMRKTPPKSRAPKIVPADAPKHFNGWDDTPAAERNAFQKVAAKTRGVVTPGNAVTLAANAVAVSGIVEMCTGNFAQGAALFAGARSGDFIDGKVARSTGTQSWLGEALDVGGDKLQTVLGLGMLSIYGDYPLEASVPKLATQIAIVGVSAVATKKGADLHPGMAGKVGLGATGASMVGFEAANALTQHHDTLAATGTTIGSYVLTALSIAASGKAAWDYWQSGRQAGGAAYAEATATQPMPAPAQLPVVVWSENGF